MTTNDAGCGHACLRVSECPYPQCLLEPGGWKALAFLVEAQRTASGETGQELAARFGVSTRTIQRLLRLVRQEVLQQ